MFIKKIKQYYSTETIICYDTVNCIEMQKERKFECKHNLHF